MKRGDSMSYISRRSFVRGAAAVSLGSLSGLPRRASAAEFVYKYANNVPATHPMTVRMQEAAKKILEESGGKVEVRVFPNNQLGGDTDMLSQLRSGALEMFTLSGVILSTISKPMSMSGVAFAFPDYDHVWQVYRPRLVGHRTGAYAARAAGESCSSLRA